MIFRYLLIGATLVSATPVVADICVENGSEEDFVFTIANDAQARVVVDLAPGGSACLSNEGGAAGTVAVFQSRSDIEGCSRRVRPDSITKLRDFPSVDLCRWEDRKISD